jgi:hypothetical protein
MEHMSRLHQNEYECFSSYRHFLESDWHIFFAHSNVAADNNGQVQDMTTIKRLQTQFNDSISDARRMNLEHGTKPENPSQTSLLSNINRKYLHVFTCSFCSFT